jgi:hypothetical protein
MRAILIASCLICACPKPPPPGPPPPKIIGGIPACALDANVELTVDEICPGLFTHEGFSCVLCPNLSGCIHVTDQVYCVEGGCMLDSRCSSMYPFDGKKR